VLIGQSMYHSAITHHQSNALRLSSDDAAVGRTTGDYDRTRFEKIVLPHLDDASALAASLIQDPWDAEDVVQDACLHALRNIDSFAGDNARAWLLTIVRQRAHFRRRKDHSAVTASDAGSEVLAAAPSIAGEFETPELALIAKGDQVRLQAAIATLPSPFLETVMLREVQGLSYHEIAGIVGVPIGTVMSRLARGRHLLISAFETSDS
jgi:RNA polymerase sigma-70 factor (ECF subfamily)